MRPLEGYLLNPDEFYTLSRLNREKGRELYKQGLAQVVAFIPTQATCRVIDKGDALEVTIQSSPQSYPPLLMKCTCAESARSGQCRHMVAAMLATREYIANVAEKDWRYRFETALARTAHMAAPAQQRAATRTEAVIVLAGLEFQKFGASEAVYLLLYGLPARRWPPASSLAEGADANAADAARELLAAHDDWHAQVKLCTPREHWQPINLSAEDLNILLASAAKVTRYESLYRSTEALQLPVWSLILLNRFKVPLFLKEGDSFVRPLRVHPEEIPITAVVLEKGDSYELQAGITLEGRIYPLGQIKFISTSMPPMWAMAGDTLMPVVNEAALNIGHAFPLRVPRDEAEDFRQNYLSQLNAYMPIGGEVVRWEEVRVAPVPRLYLRRGADQQIEAELRFGYGEYEYVSAGARPVSEETIQIPGQWGGVRVLRDNAREQDYYSQLSDPRFGLKRIGNNRPGVFALRARTHPLDFLMKCVPALTAAGYEIYGEKDIAKVNRHRPTLSLNISSGIDWFDVQAIVMYGDQQVSLAEIRRALKRNERYIKLADGSVGQIPEDWLEKYKHLFALAEETETGLRVNELHLSLLDELLADAETVNMAPEYQAKRERLKSFERITPQPLPQGFSGDLRPYQKAGYDWLHFLREYGFGGILADDMGLGKTVQALVFLQSLKERGALSRPALLVVPKSLLANWQREAERFTPGLRLLMFMGQTRKKEPAHFENYDIILTTYGTMLRDIQFLRDYRFTYAVLDESQAIKNPLSQSSKAARLLQADHRLCLTGTPVENNVYELWSQFAFLNPGLLGSLDYFKSEFGAAIERGAERGEQRGAQDSAEGLEDAAPAGARAPSAAQVLRRLTYPFILRRTKEQVAPELPARTERILYTDLEPAQRKLYHQTREHYRSLLLGLLDEGQNIQSVRFKILEGLLRLRQVCIHPRLVEPAYHGESAKFELALETLETLRSEGHKALVFSQFVQTLTLLRREMDARGMTYAYLDGKTQNRQEQVDLFQNDPRIPFFLISLRAGGVGLNLTAADYVLHIDPWWNPAVEMQAADRAHRIGQDKPVFIYKFIARETIEEKILQLQAQKRDLVERLISAENGFFKSLTPEDVQMLFS